MKLPLVLLLLSCVPSLASAQSEQHDLKTLLQDSSYLFNRYEEITSGMEVQIDSWVIPKSLKTNMKLGLSLEAGTLSTEKPKLTALLSQTDVSASDLLDVYSEVEDISNHLSDQSTSFERFGNDEGKAIDLAKLGAKAGMLAQNLEFVLAEKIIDLESQLSSCKVKGPVQKAKHKPLPPS
jgi:hypothetical protein